MESLSDRLKRESLLVHGKVGPRALIKGNELIFGLICAYEDRPRPNLLKSVIRISSWRGVEEPQEAIGAVVSASDGKQVLRRKAGDPRDRLAGRQASQQLDCRQVH